MPNRSRYLPTPTMAEICHRTIGGRRFFRPAPALTALILGVLGRALRLYPVGLHAFVYLSNHAHFLLSVASADVLAAFECHVKRNTTLAMKEFVEWEGPVWSRSSVVPVLDDLASIQRLRYVLSNSVKEGLVASPLDWPGASGAAAVLDGQPIPATWGPNRLSCPITLEPLPCWQNLSAETRSERASALIAGVIAEAKLARDGRPPLGVAGVLACDPLETVELEESRAPLCHTTDARLRAKFLAERAHFLDNLAETSKRFRSTVPTIPFPVNSFPPAPAFLSPTRKQE